METSSKLELSDKAFSKLHEVIRDSEKDATPTPELVKLMRNKNERVIARQSRNK